MMSLVTNTFSYQTNDLTYWPEVRHLKPEFLARVDRFYLYRDGNLLLLLTFDDEVYFIAPTDMDWLPPQEIAGLSGQGVIEMLGLSYLYALTSDGRLFAVNMDNVWMLARVIFVNVCHFAGDIHLYVLLHDGTVSLFVSQHWDKLCVQELVSCGPVIAIDSYHDQAAVLTATGMCLIITPFYNEGYLTGRFRVIQVPVLPSQPIELKLSYTLSILGSDGRLYCFADSYNFPVSNGVIDARPRVVSLDEPIRYVHNCQAIEGNSGKLYQLVWAPSLHWQISLTTTFPDQFSTNSHLQYRSSPGLTTITHFSRFTSELLTDSRDGDLRIVLFEDGEDEKEVCCANRAVLCKALPWLREELNLSARRDTIALPHLDTFDFTAIDTLLFYLRYLYTQHVDGFEQRAVALYVQAMLLKDHFLRDLLVSVISRQLGQLYLRSRLDFDLYLGRNLNHSSYFDEDNLNTPTQPDSTLQARVFRYIMFHPNRRLFLSTI